MTVSTSKTAGPHVVVGLGEALFDVFPDRRVVGGAPLNVAVHAQQVGRLLDCPVRGVVASRVGTDPAGDELISIIDRFGVDAQFVQRDSDLPTGCVAVSLDEAGLPTYNIEYPSAWDAFDAADERWLTLAGQCHAICFGTLAQRDPRSRRAIRAFLAAAPHAIRLLDVNLRQQFHDADTIHTSLELATMLKANEHEAPLISHYLCLKDGNTMGWARECMNRFDLDAVALTRGARGTLLYTRDGAFESEDHGAEVMRRFVPEMQADAVGAGDACSAGLLVGWLAGLSSPEVVRICDRLGGYVAGRRGATPTLPGTLLA